MSANPNNAGDYCTTRPVRRLVRRLEGRQQVPSRRTRAPDGGAAWGREVSAGRKERTL
jgi:hypothetical protein